jgi:hypothetical protein
MSRSPRFVCAGCGRKNLVDGLDGDGELCDDCIFEQKKRMMRV